MLATLVLWICINLLNLSWIIKCLFFVEYGSFKENMSSNNMWTLYSWSDAVKRNLLFYVVDSLCLSKIVSSEYFLIAATVILCMCGVSKRSLILRYSTYIKFSGSLWLLGSYTICANKVPLSCYKVITKTRLYNFDPLKPHFYKVKLGFTGLYIIFSYFAKKHRLWVLVRTASPRRF